jgi:hypothetical protein
LVKRVPVIGADPQGEGECDGESCFHRDCEHYNAMKARAETAEKDASRERRVANEWYEKWTVENTRRINLETKLAEQEARAEKELERVWEEVQVGKECGACRVADNVRPGQPIVCGDCYHQALEQLAEKKADNARLRKERDGMIRRAEEIAAERDAAIKAKEEAEQATADPGASGRYWWSVHSAKITTLEDDNAALRERVAGLEHAFSDAREGLLSDGVGADILDRYIGPSPAPETKEARTPPAQPDLLQRGRDLADSIDLFSMQPSGNDMRRHVGTPAPETKEADSPPAQPEGLPEMEIRSFCAKKCYGTAESHALCRSERFDVGKECSNGLLRHVAENTPCRECGELPIAVNTFDGVQYGCECVVTIAKTQQKERRFPASKLLTPAEWLARNKGDGDDEKSISKPRNNRNDSQGTNGAMGEQVECASEGHNGISGVTPALQRAREIQATVDRAWTGASELELATWTEQRLDAILEALTELQVEVELNSKVIVTLQRWSGRTDDHLSVLEARLGRVNGIRLRRLETVESRGDDHYRRLSALESTTHDLAHEIDEQATRTVSWCERLEARLDEMDKSADGES